MFCLVGPRLCPFLEEHKEDILCGPVWLASGLDLSGHAGMLTLTSPKLVKGKLDILLFYQTRLEIETRLSTVGPINCYCTH